MICKRDILIFQMCNMEYGLKLHAKNIVGNKFMKFNNDNPDKNWDWVWISNNPDKPWHWWTISRNTLTKDYENKLLKLL